MASIRAQISIVAQEGRVADYVPTGIFRQWPPHFAGIMLLIKTVSNSKELDIADPKLANWLAETSGLAEFEMMIHLSPKPKMLCAMEWVKFGPDSPAEC